MDNKTLCVKLAYANTEKEVVDILIKAGYWDDNKSWTYYGGRENNFSTIGNQQSKPDQALVEKLINSIDTSFLAECYKLNIDPESKEAPQSISDGMMRFFNIENGKLANLNALERTKLSENICLVSTGNKTSPSYSIIDKGEGQFAEEMKNTLLSLDRSNKLRIPFVQGKFNMGGTGVFRFCGEKNLQIIITKRNPALLTKQDINEWGFTIVRRDDPASNVRSSCYRYLAPNKKILTFQADTLNLLPGKYPDAYSEPLAWGTFIKLYEYNIGPGLRTNILFDLYNRLSLLMPSLGLPIRLFERRKGYTGHTFETTLSGLTVRLEEDKRENLEDGFPTSATVTIDGQNLKVLIFAFKRNQKEKYAKNEGAVFSINGQTHGFLTNSFFTRNSVQLGYIADSILILIDCSDIAGRHREDLFMNSRDRLSEGKLKSSIESALADLLKNHRGLRELKEKRRREDIEGKLEDSKPLAEVIENILKNSPTLSKLFIKGIRLPNPFNTKGSAPISKYEGKRFPSFFKLEKEFPRTQPKLCPINHRFRIKYKTDAVNDYLYRDNDPGKFSLKIGGIETQNFSINLWNGTATLQVELPTGAYVGDILHFASEVIDVNKAEALKDEFNVKIDKKIMYSGGNGGRRKPPIGDENGDEKNKDQLASPNILEIKEEEWVKYDFTKEHALKVIDSGEHGYDFYINMDNIHLLTEQKANTKTDHKLLSARYKYGMVLIGLAILKEADDNPENENGENKFSKIVELTKAISPILLPMISGLSELKEELIEMDEIE
ncbi:MAG: hypothetical protein PVF17_01585 [Ignavibacteria bacterium]|jgi:hypothetical protein